MEKANYSIISPEIASLIGDRNQAKIFISEAAFGYQHIKPYLSNLPRNSEILEIGAGPCVLLSQFNKDFPHLRFTDLSLSNRVLLDLMIHSKR